MIPQNTDQQALHVAQQVHRRSGAKQTFLFGSRARGDHRQGSDIDLLVITESEPPATWLEDLRQEARMIQTTQMPQASHVDVIHMTAKDFLRRIRLRNNMANTIAKEGCPVMTGENLEYRYNSNDEEVDWNDVDLKMSDAEDAAGTLEDMAETGILERRKDKQFGRIAQNALEFAYKAAIAAHGYGYPTSGRDGHNLALLAGLLREYEIIGRNEEAPGENHRYLTEFGGAAVYAHEHSALDKYRIAREVPEAVARLKELTDRARP